MDWFRNGPVQKWTGSEMDWFRNGLVQKQQPKFEISDQTTKLRSFGFGSPDLTNVRILRFGFCGADFEVRICARGDKTEPANLNLNKTAPANLNLNSAMFLNQAFLNMQIRS